MSKEWKISDSQKQLFTTNLVAGEIQEDQLKDGQTSEHRNMSKPKKSEEEEEEEYSERLDSVSGRFLNVLYN
jgi:hypothetical protein